MEKPYHQILGGKRKNLITKSFSNSLSRLPHIWGIWKNLITKSLEGKGKTSSPNPSPILYLDYHMFGGYGKTLSPNPWREKEKPHHQILLQFSFQFFLSKLRPFLLALLEKPHNFNSSFEKHGNYRITTGKWNFWGVTDSMIFVARLQEKGHGFHFLDVFFGKKELPSQKINKSSLKNDETGR